MRKHRGFRLFCVAVCRREGHGFPPTPMGSEPGSGAQRAADGSQTGIGWLGGYSEAKSQSITIRYVSYYIYNGIHAFSNLLCD